METSLSIGHVNEARQVLQRSISETVVEVLTMERGEYNRKGQEKGDNVNGGQKPGQKPNEEFKEEETKFFE